MFCSAMRKIEFVKLILAKIELQLKVKWFMFGSTLEEPNISKTIVHIWNQFWLLQKWNQTFIAENKTKLRHWNQVNHVYLWFHFKRDQIDFEGVQLILAYLVAFH